MGQTEQALASFIADYPASGIPEDIRHIGKRLWLNTMGVAIFAAKDPAIGILEDLFASEGGTAKATVIGLGNRVNLRNAALANGFLAHFEDYDDTHLGTVIHAASPIYPAALAVAEDIGASGEDLLAAGIIGIEVACRIGNLIVPHFREAASQWHITNTCGVFGAAAAAARLLGLTTDQIEHCLGVAGTQAMGFREVFGSMSKPFHAGKAAENGLLAALLCKRGFTSVSADSEGILTGSRGFAGSMAKGYDVTTVAQGFGESWQLPRIAIKPHACGQANHSLLDSVAGLRNKHGVTPDNLVSMHGTVERAAPAIINRIHPQIGLEGKFSYHHGMACVLVDGHAFPQQFIDSKVQDPLIISLRDRISISVDPSLPRFGASVTAKLKDGTTCTVTTPASVGSPTNPLSDELLIEKYRVLASTMLPASKVDQLAKAVWSMEKVASVRDLTPLMSASGKVAA